MKKEISLFETVALLEELAQHNLQQGEVGAVVEILAPDVYEVEFCDDEGRTYAMLALRGKQLLALHNQGKPWKSAAQQ
jgi:Domain of unknown function (DUF4926)